MANKKLDASSDSAVLKSLQAIPNIGPACARDLVMIGVRSIEDLKSRSPDQMYDQLCSATGARQDPCVWDVFAAAVDFAKTGEPKTWWSFTAERKRLRPDLSKGSTASRPSQS